MSGTAVLQPVVGDWRSQREPMCVGEGHAERQFDKSDYVHTYVCLQ